MFAKIRLRYGAEETIRVSPFKGNWFRSALGAMCRRMGSGFYEMCFLGEFFTEGLACRHPLPLFVPECDDARELLNEGDQLNVDVLLILPHMTWEHFFHGFKSMFYGNQLKLVCVDALDFCANEWSVVADATGLTESLPTFSLEGLLQASTMPEPVKRLEVRLLSPLRLLHGHKGVLVEKPTFADLVFACYRRIAIVEEGLRRTDPSHLHVNLEALNSIAQAAACVTSLAEGSVHEWYRVKRENESKKSVSMSGVVGTIMVELESFPFLNIFMPFLRAGTFLHVGRGITCGNGYFKLVIPTLSGS